VTTRPQSSYSGPMDDANDTAGDATGETTAPAPDVMTMFDTGPADSLVCRVCGSLVAGTGEYPRAHWDWHETPNGA
jgi:hypothetical protein